METKRVSIVITYLNKDVKNILMDVVNRKGLEEGIAIQLSRQGGIITLADIYERTHIEFAHAIQDMVIEDVKTE